MDKFRSMETFVRIANAGSLVKAAKQLNISPALVTKQLKDLEEYLGTRLFHRTTRKIALTDTGHEYFRFCNRTLGQIDEEERHILQRESTPRGHIKISSPMGFGNLSLAPIVSKFLDNYPEIQITLVLSDITPTPAYLIEEGYDLAVVFGQLTESNLIARPLGEAQWVTCASQDYLEKNGWPTSPQDLIHHNCLVHQKVAPNGHWQFRRDGAIQDIRVSGTLHTNSVFALRAATLESVGLTILPEYCIGKDIIEQRLVNILPDWPVVPRQIHLLYPHRQYIPLRLRTFIDFLTVTLSPK